MRNLDVYDRPGGASDESRELPHRDRERLGELLVHLQPRLLAVALRITRDPETARDAVQSAFEKVVKHGADFEGRARVSTWVHRIVTNEALMWLRSERRRSVLRNELHDDEVDAIPDPAPGPAETLDSHTAACRLRAGIAQLPTLEREVVESCGLAGASYIEFGRRTGTHPAAIKSRAFRARERLRRILS